MSHDLFGGLEPPSPPAGLREAALAAGLRGLRAAPAADAWSRLFRSPAARLAWSAAILLLALAHALVPREGPAPAATAAVEPEVSEVAHVSRIAENGPPRSGGFAFEGGPL